MKHYDNKKVVHLSRKPRACCWFGTREIPATLVISEDDINNLLNIINVIPITTRKPGRKVYPNEALISANNFGLSNESVILCHQIRTWIKKGFH